MERTDALEIAEVLTRKAARKMGNLMAGVGYALWDWGSKESRVPFGLKMWSYVDDDGDLQHIVGEIVTPSKD